MNNNYLKAFLLSVALTGFFYCLITFLCIALGVLSFSDQSSQRALIKDIPISIVLLQFMIPAFGLLLYRFLNQRFPNNHLDKFSLSLSNLMLGICVAMLFFGYLKSYTLITFLILFALLLYIEYKSKLRFMYRYYRTYLTTIIPFYLLCLFIKNQIPLLADQNATLKLNLIHLPIEVFAYFMGILLMSIYLFEFFKNKALKANG